MKKHIHCVKSVCIRCYSGLHFPAIGLNTERYSEIRRNILFECEKIRTRITPIRTIFTQWLLRVCSTGHYFFRMYTFPKFFYGNLWDFYNVNQFDFKKYKDQLCRSSDFLKKTIKMKYRITGTSGTERHETSQRLSPRRTPVLKTLFKWSWSLKVCVPVNFVKFSRKLTL